MPRTSKTHEHALEGTVPLMMTIPDAMDDDIPEPTTPLSVLVEAQASQLVQPAVNPNTPAGQLVMSVDEAMYRFSQHAATVLAAVEKSWDATLHKLDQNETALERFADALKAYAPCVPFAGTVSVITPAGYPLSVTVQAPTHDEFMDRMGAMLSFFQLNQFQPGAPF